MCAKYTVSKCVDHDLGGIPARIVLQFEDGSALEVTLEQIKILQSDKESV